MTSLPSWSFMARSRASPSSRENVSLSRASVVSVTVSQGVPDKGCMDRVSRSRLIFACMLRGTKGGDGVATYLHPRPLVLEPMDAGTSDQLERGRRASVVPLLYDGLDAQLVASKPAV